MAVASEGTADRSPVLLPGGQLLVELGRELVEGARQLGLVLGEPLQHLLAPHFGVELQSPGRAVDPECLRRRADRERHCAVGYVEAVAVRVQGFEAGR